MGRARGTTWGLGGVASIAIALMSGACMNNEAPMVSSVILQGDDTAAVAAAVEKVGGEVTHELGIINAVVADLSPSQIDEVRRVPAVAKLCPNRTVESAAKKIKTDKTLVIVEPTLAVVDSTSVAAADDAGTTLFAEELTETTPVVDTGASYPILVGAHRLHREGITGYGVTVAVLDTGIGDDSSLSRNTNARLASWRDTTP